MTHQPEQILENNLIEQLVQLGYQKVILKDENDVLKNLKSLLEIHNSIKLSDNDFKQILNYLNKGNIFERAKTLRDRVPFTNDKGESKTIELLNREQWCQNQFQVAQQISMQAKYKNRYDVTLLINGLPLVQIELKRRGLELKEAFNQINRYQRQSYFSGYGLFQFIQIFVISNGVNTKYYANNSISKLSFKQTFFWADKNNKLITQLTKFADEFLEKCHISKMISKYIVLNEANKMLMVLRPYQFYATESIIETVKTTNKFGYIWHTTGSGKTLTSFKTSQILTHLPKVYKVLFVVDRNDLDYQTSKEFNSFSKDSVDSTLNTKTLVNQLADDTKLIVTTIQKLNNAVTKSKYLKKIEHLQDKKIVFIFDECHRSQFGKTHKAIKTFFQNSQMFGFTGTPIFEENAASNEFGKRTTSMLFGECLHKYVITDAIRDENVLKFSIEYISTFKQKEKIIDINVEDINEKEVMDFPKRLENISDYIILNHKRKTHNRKYTSIFTVSGIPILIEYYKLFEAKKKAGLHDLTIATIFSYQDNEEDQDVNTFFDGGEDFLSKAAENPVEYKHKHSREQLDYFISEYNKEFKSNFSTKDGQSFYNYYKDVAKRVKACQIDVLLVVDMFLTGFDSKPLNTLYVDRNLQYHGLIQAFSRTNRILDERKSQGNIVCFRNLKDKTDEAITLFSNIEAKDEILMKPYDEYIQNFNKAYLELLDIAPSVKSVDDLASEIEEAEFIKAFRDIMRLKNVLSSFTEFSFNDLSMAEQQFEDYKSKYLDLYDKTRNYNRKEKVSILDDLDFELELIHKDEVNVSYILKLLAKLKDTKPKEQEKMKKRIIEEMAGDALLRSKKDLIEKFINENLPHIEVEEIDEEFDSFWQKERIKAVQELSKEENLDNLKLEQIIGNYLFTEKKPLRDDVIGMMNKRPSLKERGTTAERITSKIMNFVETFINGIRG